MRRDDLAERDRDHGVIAALAEAAVRAVARRPGHFALAALALAVVGYAGVNALALQEGEHPSAFFETRDPAWERPVAGTSADETGAVTRIVFDDDAERRFGRQRPQAAETPLPLPVPRAEMPAAAPDDPVVELQRMLAGLGFYEGEIDGIKGPVTRDAVERYKVSVGLRGIELTIAELLTSLRNNTMVTAAIPTPRPRADEGAAALPPPADPLPTVLREAPPPDRTVLKVQAGLKAFGNAAITVDGVAGDQTRAAVREFQALFRMPVTGEIDRELVDKMAAIGLID